MRKLRTRIQWMSAAVASIAAAACGITVSEPIVTGQASSAVSPLPRGTLVKDLSTADATAWCTWYVEVANPLVAPPPAPVEVQDGYTCERGSMIICGQEPTSICVGRPAIEQCVQNLQRRPCEAPISELDDCVHSMFYSDTSTGVSFDCGGHCAAFRARPNCDTTVVQEKQNEPVGGACSAAAWGHPDAWLCRLPVE